MEIALHPFDYHSPLLHDAINIYCTVWQRDKEDSTIFFRKYTQQVDFLGYVACLDNQAVGFAMGTASESGQWWHDKVAKSIGENHRALTDAWVLIELAVLESYRHRKIGTILHNYILRKQTHSNVLLSTQVDNFPARRFYEEHGWTYLHDGIIFNKGREPFCIMHKEIDHET